jgi:murein DD-endopeptidase MepM/ murein hydrolase activator NlpD
MKLSILTLTAALFFSISSFAQQLPLPIDTIPAIIEPSEMDSLLNTIEDIHEDSLKSLDETLYKNNWSCTQIKYPENTMPGKADTITIIFSNGSDGGFVPPYKGKIISKFGIRHGRMHTGTDIKLNSGDTVRCAFDGKVRLAKRFSGYGNLVLVRHNNGLETIYGHLKAIKVKVNDSIKAGDLIGLGGRTGRATCDHLHFETRLFGQAFDGAKYIDYDTFSLKTDKIYYANKRFEVDKANFKKKPTAAEAEMLADGTVRKHVIRKGDTLSGIARKYHTSVKKICTTNHITTQTTLKIGRVLKIS